MNGLCKCPARLTTDQRAAMEQNKPLADYRQRVIDEEIAAAAAEKQRKGPLVEQATQV